MDPSHDVYRRRQQARRRAAQRRARRLRFLCGVLFLLLILLVACIFLKVNEQRNPLVETVTIEAGSSPDVQMFLADPQAKNYQAAFKTDMTSIDVRVPGTHLVEITVDGKDYTANLEILDRTAPTGKAVEDYATNVGILPEAQELVTDLEDLSDVTVAYLSEPDVSQGGTVTARVKLTDAYGNSSVLEVALTITADTEPPVIEGAADKEIYLGNSIAYKEGITVTDNETAKPKLTVDNSLVDTTTAGTYPVTYTATDDAGNVTSVTVNLTIKEKPKDYVDEAMVYEKAQEVLDKITTPEMSDMEVAFAIYKWTKSSISYTGSSDKSSWVKAAYQAFTKQSGDCYNYFAAAKALYNLAGIDNIDVIKSDTSHSSHFWSLINLGDGWYHVDCTPRRKVGYFFMNTDAELEEYSKKNKNSHIFDSDAYPERATESVQDLIDYKAGKVKD